MELRPVGPEAREQLAVFRCATVRAEYSLEVEQTIREDRADALESKVHEDNYPMLALNQKLNATFEKQDDDPQYYLSFVVVSPDTAC